jgi:ABC-type sugar transport system substrate-binding protein
MTRRFVLVTIFAIAASVAITALLMPRNAGAQQTTKNLVMAQTQPITTVFESCHTAPGTTGYACVITLMSAGQQCVLVFHSAGDMYGALQSIRDNGGQASKTVSCGATGGSGSALTIDTTTLTVQGASGTGTFTF